MAKHQNGAMGNGKVSASRLRVPETIANGVLKRDTTFVRSSHSLSTPLAGRLRALAYEKQTSESSIIECALWLFFKNGSDAKVLRLMTRAEIAPRRRRV
ncbi:MAG TPA: hypothetical protein VII69_08485 [Candidatus Eremiobacteraceae bacterium]